jgi:hypothetical protein
MSLIFNGLFLSHMFRTLKFKSFMTSHFYNYFATYLHVAHSLNERVLMSTLREVIAPR